MTGMINGFGPYGAGAAQRYTAHMAAILHQRVFQPTGVPAGSATSPAAIATAAAQGAAVAPGGGFVVGGITGTGPATAPAVVDAANLRTQNINIPASLVGCIFGKGGSKITEIRRLSGSRISIAKVAHDQSGDRLFTIQGTPASNEKALYLLYNQVCLFALPLYRVPRLECGNILIGFFWFGLYYLTQIETEKERRNVVESPTLLDENALPTS